jgi:hypothetical protein
MNKESSIAAISSLWLRHKDAANQYRKALALAGEEGLKSWFTTLVKYREDLEKDCRDMLKTLPPVPFTPNKNITSGLNKKWAEIKEALLLENYSKLTSACWEAEQYDYEALKESLKIASLPDGIAAFLDKQGKSMLRMQRKVERMSTIPNLSENTLND